jgi:hypothetical protein
MGFNEASGYWITSVRDKARRPPARRALSTTSTTRWPGASSPFLFAAHGLLVAQIGVLAALYQAVWGFGQLFTGW